MNLINVSADIHHSVSGGNPYVTVSRAPYVHDLTY